MRNYLETRPVIAGGQKSLGDGHPNPVAKSLSQRSGGYFDSRGDPALRMTRGFTAPLTKLLDLVKRKIVTGEMQQTVKKHRTMPGRKNEAVPVEPIGIAGV